jgi:indole-3-glycerol phosphate synthase
MDILEKIVINKRKEVAIRKQLISVQHLERSDLFHRPTSSLKNALTNSTTGIIAEYKRRSPSKSVRVYVECLCLQMVIFLADHCTIYY